MNEEETITTREAARIKCVNHQTIYNAIRDGRIVVARRVGVSLLLNRRDVERWEPERRHKPKGQAACHGV